MNWSNNFNSVSTLAHELGHSMHSYFSDTYQDYYNSQYPIILAEIASTFNEVLLAEHLLKTSDDIKLKFYILNNLLILLSVQFIAKRYEVIMNIMFLKISIKINQWYLKIMQKYILII